MSRQFVLCAAFLVFCGSSWAQNKATQTIVINYPQNETIFPPDLAPPTFLWTDASDSSVAWQVEVKFSNSQTLKLTAAGERMRIGEIDERAIADTNEPPKLTAEQALMRTWKPDSDTWNQIKKNSVGRVATVQIRGFADAGMTKVVSEGQVRLTTSEDAVGAPIFFRDVPLMPAQVEKGVIRPLPKSALPLVAWRLRYVGEDKSRLMVDNLPTCANCHSFSKDGKTLGLDMDGPQNDKGLYALVPIKPETTIRKDDMIAWSSYKGKLGSKIRVGFMSQVSPDGQHVVTMVNGSDVLPNQPSTPGANAPLPKDVGGNFYVSNFKDYRFLQVFYPTRGLLAWYSRDTGKLQPLPGADDPKYVHTNATWSPDGKYLVFARAEARDPYPEGSKLAEKSNDPNETPIQYDLYRIPFNGGAGGKPERIEGASQNGKSNSFPKISPDGKWIVYVQARNGLLMRPDGQLYIVPATGGKPRKMNCNTPLMNSWHSFSPNGRWLVFSSKSRSPYTQMYLTHIDENGNDSPPVLIENSTAANRAVNIPEFVNIGADEWLKIEAPATEFYRISDKALELSQSRNYDAAITEWQRALEMDPVDTTALNNLGATLTAAQRFDDAAVQFRKALEVDPDNYKAHSNLGVALARSGKFDDAVAPLQTALRLNGADGKALSALGGILVNQGKLDEAAGFLKKALEIDPTDSDAHNNLGGVLARSGNFAEAVPHFLKALEVEPNSFALHYNLGRALGGTGKFTEGIVHLEKAAQLTGGQEPIVLDKLSAMYAEASRFNEALAAARRGAELARQQQNRELADALAARVAVYESKQAGVSPGGRLQ